MFIRTLLCEWKFEGYSEEFQHSFKQLLEDCKDDLEALVRLEKLNHCVLGPSNKEKDHPKASTNDEMATDREKVELETRHTLQQSFEMELKEASMTDEIQHSTTPNVVETSGNL
ncbi:hypothetical protein CsSME_00032547 [Camellia sinensis var. sinensis]